MRYFDWNIVIGNYFFNYEKGGKDVHLFISPLEIGEIGINQLGFTSKEEAMQIITLHYRMVMQDSQDRGQL